MPEIDHTRPGGFVLPPDGGDGYWWWGATSVNKLTGDRTGGRVDASVQLMPPGYAPPRHSHESDEFFYILSGELRIFCDDATWDAGPDTFVFFPQGSVHGFEVTGCENAKMLIVTAGANFADLVAALGERTDERGLPPDGHGEVSMEAMVEASARLGIHYAEA